MSCGIRRILQFQEAVTYAKITVYDANNINITNQCQYSWSHDGVCWTSWSNYATYISTTKHIEADFYLRILLFGSFGSVSLNDVVNNCYNICIDSSNNFLKEFCGEPNLFQPYQNLDCALLLQQQLADSIVCMFGIPVYYFKTTPREETADYTFKEFVLHDVVAVKQLKLMITDGQMPSSNPKLTDFDFDWETDWETEISKTQFARAFGDTAFPHTQDFIYIPMMKRMWEVNAAYDEKKEGLMWRSTTWKLSLVKYNDSTNILVDGFENLIDNWLVNEYDDVFGEIEANEQDRQTAGNQIDRPSFAATNLYDIFMEDAIRKQFTKDDIDIYDKIYCHHNTILARNIYRFKNENACVIYQKGICGDSGTIIFMLEVENLAKESFDKDIMNFGPIDIQMAYVKDSEKFLIGCHDLYTEIDPMNTYMVVYKWNRKNFTTEFSVYPYTYDKTKPKYILRPEHYWFDFENPVCELVGVYNNDYIIDKPQQCQVHAYPVKLSNIRLYNDCLSREEAIKESITYITKNDKCVFNDAARQILSGHGYTVK